MNKLKQSFAAKLIAVILLSVTALTFTASAALSIGLYNSGVYTMGYDAAARQMLDGIGENMCFSAAAAWRDGSYEGGAVPAVFRFRGRGDALGRARLRPAGIQRLGRAAPRLSGRQGRGAEQGSGGNRAVDCRG